MPLKKLYVNLIFALLVLALGATAAGSLIVMRSKNSAAPNPSGSRLPQDHPPIDMSKEVMELEQLSAQNPKSADYRTQIGNIYYDRGQYDKAVVYYQQSLDLHPRNPNVETDLAACFHYLGQDDKALDILNKVLEYSPDFAEAMFNKGIVLISGKKDVKGGILVWENLLRSNPEYPRRVELQKSIDQLKSANK
jgi:tetratricopeptide (TPR) repeat protein